VRTALTIVYVANADSREIYVFELAEKDGSSKLVEIVAVGGAVMPMAISPDRKHLFASLRSEPYSVSNFAMDPNSGRLRLLETVPLVDNMAHITTDRSGRYLLGASYFGNKIAINVITRGGRIDPKPLAVIPTGKNAHYIAPDLTNKFLFVTNLGDDAILQYRFDASSGAISPNEPPAVLTRKGAGPRHLAFHPNGRLVFGSNELDGTVSSYWLEFTGTLTLRGSVSIIPPGFTGGAPSAAQLHLTPDGRFLYASERTSSTLAAFGIDSDNGALTLIGNHSTEAQPRGFNIDPKGKYLLAAGQKSNRLSTYAINQTTGKLRKLSHLEVGQNPNWIEIVSLPAPA
jgi:6-phosphogluconolactonase